MIQENASERCVIWADSPEVQQGQKCELKVRAGAGGLYMSGGGGLSWGNRGRAEGVVEQVGGYKQEKQHI